MTIKSLESLIGRLNHASYLIPLGRHFLNSLREKINSTNSSHSRRWAAKKVKLNQDDLEDPLSQGARRNLDEPCHL